MKVSSGNSSVKTPVTGGSSSTFTPTTSGSASSKRVKNVAFVPVEGENLAAGAWGYDEVSGAFAYGEGEFGGISHFANRANGGTPTH